MIGNNVPPGRVVMYGLESLGANPDVTGIHKFKVVVCPEHEENIVQGGKNELSVSTIAYIDVYDPSFASKHPERFEDPEEFMKVNLRSPRETRLRAFNELHLPAIRMHTPPGETPPTFEEFEKGMIARLSASLALCMLNLSMHMSELFKNEPSDEWPTISEFVEIYAKDKRFMLLMEKSDGPFELSLEPQMRINYISPQKASVGN